MADFGCRFASEIVPLKHFQRRYTGQRDLLKETQREGRGGGRDDQGCRLLIYMYVRSKYYCNVNYEDECLSIEEEDWE